MRGWAGQAVLRALDSPVFSHENELKVNMAKIVRMILTAGTVKSLQKHVLQFEAVGRKFDDVPHFVEALKDSVDHLSHVPPPQATAISQHLYEMMPQFVVPPLFEGKQRARGAASLGGWGVV